MSGHEENDRELGPSTIAVRGGFYPAMGEGVVPPINLSATFHHAIDPDPAVLPYSYGRDRSPSFLPLETAIAQLEHAEYGIVFNAGMAAAIPLLMEAKPGTALVMAHDCYFGIRVYSESNPDTGTIVRFQPPAYGQWFKLSTPLPTGDVQLISYAVEGGIAADILTTDPPWIGAVYIDDVTIP